MGGDSSAAYNPMYDTCAMDFAHSECEPYAPFTPYTARTVHTWCIQYADCHPLHLCVLYVPCMLHMPLIMHVSCMLRVPCVLSSDDPTF